MKLRTSFSLMLVVALVVVGVSALMLGLFPARAYIRQSFLEGIPSTLTAAKAGIQTEIARG